MSSIPCLLAACVATYFLSKLLWTKEDQAGWEALVDEMLIHKGEMVIPKVYGTTRLTTLDPDISHLTRPITNKCKHCGTKNPCSTTRCPSCGAPQ